MRTFEHLFCVDDATKIVDIGGGQFNWQFLSARPKITVVNLSKPRDWDERLRHTRFVFGDGQCLAFSDKSFEIAYSNSVIEHLGTWENQWAFATEAMRVGRSVYIQTPAFEFFIEPHVLTPFIHWFPISSQVKLMRNFTAWGLLTRPSSDYINRFLAERRLLRLKEFQQLFPGCRILREKFLFMTKSYIAISLPGTPVTRRGAQEITGRQGAH